MVYPIDKIQKVQKSSALFNLYALFQQPVTQGMEKSPLGDFLQEAGFAVKDGDPWGVWAEVNVFTSRYEAMMEKAEGLAKENETPADYTEVMIWIENLFTEIEKIIKPKEDEYRKFSALPLFLRDPRSTHPSKLYTNMKKHFNGSVSSDDKRLYSLFQSLFSAPPLFAVRMGEYLIPIITGFGREFDASEIERVTMIYEVWKSELIRGEFGFKMEPRGKVLKLGFNGVGEYGGDSENSQSFNLPDVTWELVYQISKFFTGENSRISQVFGQMVEREDAPKLARVIPLFGRRAA